MKKFGFLLIVAALFGFITLGSCKQKAAEPAEESTEQVATEEAASTEASAEEAPAEEAPAEEAPAQ